MRVFYVRPSDNGNYGVEAALANSPRPPDQLDLALFRGLRVPLEPLNFDPRERGFAGLNRYDLAILAGLDPVALSPADFLALAAFVERGGGLLLIGGSHGFGNAEGTWLPLEPLLPARVLRGLDVEANVMPSLSGHPIARGLPTPLGYVSKVHPIEPKPDAQVAMKAGDLPLVVAGEHGYGRVVLLAAYPECDESEYGWFFTGDAFDDLLRQAAGWLRKQHETIWFESFTLPNRQVVTGNEEFGRLKLASADAVGVQLITRLTDARGRVVHESSASLQPKKVHETVFSFRVPDDPRARGLHYVTVIAADAADAELARRDIAIEVVNPTRVAIECEQGRRAFAPGETALLRLRASSDLKQPPAELAADVSLLDADERPVLAPRRRSLRRAEGRYDDVELHLPVPRVRPGRYTLRAELHVGDELADCAAEEIHVLAPEGGPAAVAEEAPGPFLGARFPLIAEGGWHLDRETTERAVRSLAAAGVNALSLPGPPAHASGETPHREAMLAHAQHVASCAGLAIAHHHRGLIPGLSPMAPLAPCPLAPEFRQALEEHVRPVLAAAARVPGLLFHEVAPLAAVREEQLCRCAACRAAFKRNFDLDLPPEGAGEPDGPLRRALASFVTSYWWHVLSAMQKLRDETAPGVRLALGFDATSFVLRDGPRPAYCDALVWARACDAIEVAAEPDAARFRLSLAGHRAVAAALGKPFGARLDLAEGGLAPAEAACTAIAHGAAFLRVAENPRFLLSRRQPPLEQAVGALFNRIGRAGPLLSLSSRPPARVALLFPFADAAARGSAWLLAAFGLLHAAVGEVDLLHERLATDEGLAPYGAVAVLGAEQLPARAAIALVRFVERGGLLLADRADLSDEEGAPLQWPEGFFGTAQTPLFAAITARRRRFSAGRTTLFAGDIVRAHQRAVEQRDAVAARELRRAIAEAIAEHGVRPWARSADPAVEVGVRVLQGAWLLAAANHGDEPRTARVDLDPQAPAACAFDLATGEAVPLESGDAPALTVRLAPRDGGLWALYPERPFALRLEAPQAVALRGGALSYKVSVVNESGRPAQGTHIVHVAVADPAGQERPEHGGARATTHGTLEAAQPLAANDPPGRWTVTVTDPLTRRVVQRAVEVSDEAPAADTSTEPSGEQP